MTRDRDAVRVVLAVDAASRASAEADRLGLAAARPSFELSLEEAPGEVALERAHAVVVYGCNLLATIAAEAHAEEHGPVVLALVPAEQLKQALAAGADQVLLDQPDRLALLLHALERALTLRDAGPRILIAERAAKTLFALAGREPEHLTKEIGRRLAELLDADCAGIAVLEEGAGGPPERVRFAQVTLDGGTLELARAIELSGAQHGVAAAALRTGALITIPELARDPQRELEPAFRAGFQSALAIPLMGRDTSPGVLLAFWHTPRALSEDELLLVVSLARIVGTAVEHSRLRQHTEDVRFRLRALSEITRAIGSTLDVEGVFRIVGEQLQRIVPYLRLSLRILNPGEALIHPRVILRPAPGEPVTVQMHPPIAADPSSSLMQAIAQGRPRIVERSSGTRDSMFEGEVGRYAIIPIIADQTPMGALVVGVAEGQALRAEDMELLEDLGANMAIALKNGRVFADLERAYTDLRDTKDRLVRSEKLQALGEMAAGVAHDFNNLLSAILGRAQMLKVMLGDESEEILRSVGVIEQAALDGAGTVRRIQEFAKSKSDADMTPVPLNTLVRDTVERAMTRVRANGANGAIEVAVELGEAGHVLGNASDLRQVLTNLIYNAADAMAGGGGRLIVRTGADPVGRKVWFEVEDSGHGMDEETVGKLFSPFFTTKGTRGTGLGLSVSSGIVERHRGEFSVWSEKGVGSRIRVTLPRHRTHSSPPIDEPLRHPHPERRARILVIDDDGAVRDVLADILRTGDHHVVAAPSGAEGLVLFQKADFDLVFTDLGMPGMSGWEVAAGIKSLNPRTPVGLITGWGATLDEQRMKDLGVDLIVAKPFRYKQVLELVSEAMEFKSRLGG